MSLKKTNIKYKFYVDDVRQHSTLSVVTHCQYESVKIHQIRFNEAYNIHCIKDAVMLPSESISKRAGAVEDYIDTEEFQQSVGVRNKIWMRWIDKLTGLFHSVHSMIQTTVQYAPRCPGPVKMSPTLKTSGLTYRS